MFAPTGGNRITGLGVDQDMKRAAVVGILALVVACGEPSISDRARLASGPAPGASSSPALPAFEGSSQVVDAEKRGRMSSWRPGCPVPLDDLRLLRMSFWGFDGRPHDGEMIVHRDVAAGVLGVFRALFAARFPIERVQLVDDFGADDEASMAANNTSGFNCRRSAGDGTSWSEHAYGRAIDINPIQNPYVPAGGSVAPPAGRVHVDRSKAEPGLIRAGDVVVHAFGEIGWAWGGTWSRSKDYQHFSASGR